MMTVALTAALALAGLVLRGHVRVARSFALYLGFVVLCDIGLALWPDVMWTWNGWIIRHTMFDLLKIGIALEVAYWVFLGFPGAAQSARATIFLLLIGTLVAVLAMPPDLSYDGSGFFVGEFRPRIQNGFIWVFAATAALVSWHRIPVRPIHRAIMSGFVPYLVAFTTIMKLVLEYGREGWAGYLAALDPWAYLAAALWWGWAAWQRAPQPDVSPELVARLWPWKAKAAA